jgi:hypothetical protein
MRTVYRGTILLIYFLMTTSVQAEEANPFDAEVLEVRPRIFLRKELFEGLTMEKLRSRLNEPELEHARQYWHSSPLGRALLWKLDGDKEDLDAAIADLKNMDAARGTWSDRGMKLVQLATLFDWLYEDLDDVTRRATIEKIEHASDAATKHVRNGEAPFFYSRTPSALAGLCVAGLALSGVSEKAEGYLRTFREFGVEEYFKAYDWVDGAATGATYTLFYTYTALPSICAAWWSATDHNPSEWIRTEQGDWLEGMVRFYLWYMRPGFAFTHINDQFRGDWQSHDQFCQGLDIAVYVTRNGYGRAWSERWFGRFGRSLYHPAYAHHLIFRDPTISSRPLVDLPRAELFGRDSCGYGFFRSEWPEDGEPDEATHVFFRCGDPMNVHGGVAAGEFQVFKYAPLASRGGRYADYDSPADQYHRNCISANVVLFTDPGIPDDRGDQHARRGLKSDQATWAQWMRVRERNELDVARILDWQVGPNEARCRADLTQAVPESKCRLWIREFVWLADKHLVVLDIVETTSPEIRRQWQIHLPSRPDLGDRVLAVTHRPPKQRWFDPSLQPENPEARLFCRTILPRDYTVILHGDRKAASYDTTGNPLDATEGNPYHRKYGQDIAMIDPGHPGTRTLFLHVLTAAPISETIPPDITYSEIEQGKMELTIEEATTILDVPQ